MTERFRAARPAAIAMLLAFALAGCSTAVENSGLALVDASGNHPAGFLAAHGARALPDGGPCTPCHGEDLRGGISGVSCFTASVDGRGCHAAGPTPAGHQPIATWVNAHQGTAAASRPTFSTCNAAICHGPALQGAVGPSCFSASFAGFLCHVGGPPPDFHAAGWYTDHRAFALANGTGSCADAACHGATLHADPPSAAGPSCFSASWGSLSCHAGGPLLPPPGTHETGWLNQDNTTGFHGVFVASINCSACHPVAGHPTCTTCHFDANGSRATAGFTHAFDASATPRVAHGDAQKPLGTTCENCHQTGRTFRAGSPPSCASGPGGLAHPGNEGCHYDAALLDPVLTNPRY
ncbi:MAG: hypothetical protein ACM3NF_05170 [Gemmatimonadota bacterium]